jgi:outer membrane protein, multidrug efflux system
MKKRLILIALSTSLAAGCMVGPKYNRPAVKAPDTFRGTVTPATDPASLADLKWFDVFKDDQLQGLIRVALVQNYDLRAAVTRIDAARANLGVTRSNQFPTLTVGADITKLRNSANGSFALPTGFNQERTFGETLLNLLSFEIDVWGRLRRATEAARADLLAAEENRKAVVTTLVADVSTTYFNLIELDSELEIAKRTLASRQDSLRLIRLREQGGVGTMLDVRQAEQLVITATQSIVDTERRIEQTENLLNLLAGQSPAEITRGHRLIAQQQPAEVPPGLPSSLLERRPDIRAAEQNLIASNADIGVAKAAYFPQITLTGFMGGQSNQLDSLWAAPNRTWNFVPRVTTPLFNAGRIRSNVKFAEAQQRFAVVQYERAIQTSFREVSDALVQYRKVKEVHVQRDLLVNTLRDRSRLAYLRYRGGVDTLLNALDADRDLFDAELSLAQIQRDELSAIVQLYKALGGGWQ